MPALRALGGLAALSFFLLSIRRYNRRRISRFSLIISCVLAIVVMALAISPSLFNPIFDTFNFGAGNNRRLVFVLMVAVVVLFFLLLRLQSQGDVNERSIRLLVEALGRERFDWERAAALPEGRRLVTVSPAFNEAENVAQVIADIPEEVDGYHVIPVFVSDGSDDGTAGGGARGGCVRGRAPDPPRRGLALRVGYEIALQLGADIVVTLDADGQHLPSELPVMIAPIVAGTPTT